MGLVGRPIGWPVWASLSDPHWGWPVLTCFASVLGLQLVHLSLNRYSDIFCDFLSGQSVLVTCIPSKPAHSPFTRGPASPRFNRARTPDSRALSSATQHFSPVDATVAPLSQLLTKCPTRQSRRTRFLCKPGHCHPGPLSQSPSARPAPLTS